MLARDVIYHGNIEPGDRIVVALMASRREARTLSHWCRLAREDDGARLADVLTRRAVAARS
jgi:probable biosynthetic protein (TIGR04098 family)